MPPPMIQAGKLRHRIVISQPTATQDTFGGTQIGQDTVIATVWGSVEALGGRELYAAQQKVSDVTHRITIRWMSGIRALMVCRFETEPTGDPLLNRFFQIQAVENPDERRHILTLLCIERDNSALGV